MKDYEIYSNLYVPKSSNIVLRLDGRNFHSLAKNLELKKPYDENFSKLMVEVSKDIFNEFSPKFIYTFSDEISILLSEIPFSGRVEKLNSVFSSLASSSFTFHFNEFFNGSSFSDSVDNGSFKGSSFSDSVDNGSFKGSSFSEKSLNGSIFPISFDSRVIPLISDDLINYFKWRQDEAWRNCINAYGIWALNKENSKKIANEKIKGLKSKDIHQLLFERGLNLNDLPTWQKRGIGLYKKSKEIKGFNPLKNEGTVSFRNSLFVDWDLAIFDSDFVF